MRRQVPEVVLTRGWLLGPFVFGIEMGTGARTFVTSSMPYVALATLLVVQPATALFVACGVAFGAGRWTVPMLWTAGVPSGSEDWPTYFRMRHRVFRPALVLLVVPLGFVTMLGM